MAAGEVRSRTARPARQVSARLALRCSRMSMDSSGQLSRCAESRKGYSRTSSDGTETAQQLAKPAAIDLMKTEGLGFQPLISAAQRGDVPRLHRRDPGRPVPTIRNSAMLWR